MEPTDDHRDITEVLRELARAITGGTVDNVLALFWQSEQVMVIGSEQGESAFGLAALATLWTRVLSRGQRYRWQWYDERVVRAGRVAWLSASATVVVEGTERERDVPYRATLVLILIDGQWLIAQYHGSEPAEAW
jgi:ketosteroid isomerase-like protein